MIDFSDFQAMLVVICCGILGIINAMIFKTLNDRSIIINEFLIGTVDITVLMTFTIIVWLFVGVIVAVLSSGRR